MLKVQATVNKNLLSASIAMSQSRSAFFFLTCLLVFIQITREGSFNGAVAQLDPGLAMRLPPASPFDNFLKAAGC